jgi:hypothetical protein
MASDRPRATRACATCRRLKTRCYESRLPGSSCLRCEKLGAECSLANGVFVGGNSLNATITTSTTQRPSESRLDRLERVVSTIANKVGIDTDLDGSVQINAGANPAINWQSSGSVNYSSQNGTAPVFAIRDIAAEAGVESSTAGRSAASGSNVDLIAGGLLSRQQAQLLFEL